MSIEFATPAYDAVIKLRCKILRTPLGLDFSAEELAIEYQYHHLAAYNENGKLTGCLVLVPFDDGQVKMQQVAVAEDLQKQGVGTAMVNFSESFAQAQGYNKMFLHARAAAIPFYERLDYQKVGAPFSEVNIEHYRMEKKL